MFTPPTSVFTLFILCVIIFTPAACGQDNCVASRIGPEHDSGARALAIETAGNLLDKTSESKQETFGFAFDARKTITPFLVDPREEEPALWILAGRIALRYKDEDLGAFAYEAIARLDPKYSADANLLELVTDLESLILLDRVESIPNERRAFLEQMRHAEDGDALAMGEVGRAYLLGLGVPENEEESGFWYRRGAELGDAASQNGLGEAHWTGKGAKVDRDEAIRLVRMAAEQGNATGQNNLAGLYVRGTVVKRSDSEAFRLFKLAADQNFAPAQNNLGWMYREGRGVERDTKKAFTLFEKAAEQGEPIGQVNLGAVYCVGARLDYKKAVGLFRQAAAQGNAWGQAVLGVAYHYGQGVEQDYEEALRLYRLAAKQHVPASEIGLRTALWDIAVGVPQALCNLGFLYERGLGVPQDYSKAFTYYYSSARRGWAMAQNNLGTMYARGWGTNEDLREAERWWRKAAAQGIGLARQAIADLNQFYSGGYPGVAPSYDSGMTQYEWADPGELQAFGFLPK